MVQELVHFHDSGLCPRCGMYYNEYSVLYVWDYRANHWIVPTVWYSHFDIKVCPRKLRGVYIAHSYRPPLAIWSNLSGLFSNLSTVVLAAEHMLPKDVPAIGGDSFKVGGDSDLESKYERSSCDDR